MLPPFYQQISGTGTIVLCETSVEFSNNMIENTSLSCKILNDNVSPEASESQLSDLTHFVEYYDIIGTINNI